MLNKRTVIRIQANYNWLIIFNVVLNNLVFNFSPNWHTLYIHNFCIRYPFCRPTTAWEPYKCSLCQITCRSSIYMIDNTVSHILISSIWLSMMHHQTSHVNKIRRVLEKFPSIYKTCCIWNGIAGDVICKLAKLFRVFSCLHMVHSPGLSFSSRIPWEVFLIDPSLRAFSWFSMFRFLAFFY